uniref:transmembrane protein 143-like n=1 Tax=Pristiophorus japonicus TaxID=55135 RepID=UPI00398E797E
MTPAAHSHSRRLPLPAAVIHTMEPKAAPKGTRWQRVAKSGEQSFSKLKRIKDEELSCVSEQKRASLTTLLDKAETITVMHYHTVTEQLLALYEPINPDRDTLPDISLMEPNRLDQEKVLLENLCEVLQQANFNELSSEIIQYAISQRDPFFKSQVKVDVESYEYMRFWALGVRVGAPPREMKKHMQSKRLFFPRKVKAPMDRRYCKRVIVAARTLAGRLILKSFKDIPLESLEHLLPKVDMHVSVIDRTFLYFTLLAGGSALFANLTVLGLYSLRVDFLLVMLLFVALMAHRYLRLLQHRRNMWALGHANMLYSKSTAHNADLLVGLVRRAQQEHLKELMLAHAFTLLLHQRGCTETSADRGVETAAMLSDEVSVWLQGRSGLPIAFNGLRALSHLQSLEGQLRER